MQRFSLAWATPAAISEMLVRLLTIRTLIQANNPGGYMSAAAWGRGAVAALIAFVALGGAGQAAAAEYPPEIPKDLPSIPVPGSPSPPGQPPADDPRGPGGLVVTPTDPNQPQDPTQPSNPTQPQNPGSDGSDAIQDGAPGWNAADPYNVVNTVLVTTPKSAAKGAAPNTLANPTSERPSRTGADATGLLLALGFVAVGAGTGLAVTSARTRRSRATQR